MIDLDQIEPSHPASESARCQHTRLRRRILYGRWEDDLRARIAQELNSTERSDAWGRPDVTGDVFTPACAALSTLYTPERPRATGPSTGHELVLDAVAHGGFWELMIRGQRDCLGLREWLVRIDVREDPAQPLGWALSFRPAYPDRIHATPRVGAPDEPASIREAVYCARGEDRQPRWYWECWAIEGEGAPYHRWESGSGVVLEQDAAYPYHDSDGKPVLPYALYHAERTGYLWDPWEWSRVVEGAMRIGVLWTFFGHIIRSASWPQRYTAGLTLAADVVPEDEGGTAASTGRTRVRVAADPAYVLDFHIDPESGTQPLIGAFPLSCDPEQVANAIGVYERRVTGLVGIDPASVRKDSGDPRSGYAITVTHEAQLEAQRRYEPQFRRGDLETLRIAAAILGSAATAVLPGRGYEIEYGPEIAEEETDSAAGAVAGAVPGAVQDTALNGAQVQALTAMVKDVAAGLMPRDAAIPIIARSFQVSTEEATAMLGSAGAGFRIAAPAAGGDDGAGRRAGGGAPPAAGGGDDKEGGGGGGGGGEEEDAGDGA